MPSYQYVDGRMVEIPDLVIDESCELQETIKQTVVLRNGAEVVVHGVVKGTVQVQRGSRVEFMNAVNGTVNVETGASASFFYRLGGTLNVYAGGSAFLSSSAVALGSMCIEGTLINEGVRGVNVSGSGVVEDREGSTVRLPDETWHDGTVVYRD